MKENPFFKPTGFDAIFSGITQAIKNEKLNAILHYPAYEVNGWANVKEGESAFISDVKTINYDKAKIVYKTAPDWNLTTVNVDDLKQWLASKNHKPDFFFGEQSSNAPDYLDPNHPRYSAKLAAVVMAWQSVADTKGKSPKQALTKWLREHAAEYGLIDDEGKIIELAIEECAKTANWNKGGGAPTTP